MADVDVLALLCEHLTAELAPTATDLPAGFDDAAGLLPFVQVQELPSRPRDVPYNGVALNDLIEVDIDVYAATLTAAADLARFGTPNLRSVLDAWDLPGALVLERTVPTRRPDRNPDVQRYGCIYGFLARRGG